MRLGYFLFLPIFLFSACGVRGRPTPSEIPPLLGHGEPSFSRATEKVKVPKKKKTSSNPNKDEDWNESDDFSEGDH
jgi:hypothetical protein